MKKRWFNVLLGIIVGVFLVSGCLLADQVGRNHYTNQNLNLPLDQIGQDGKQQTRNDNQQLFQTDQVGDLGKLRQKLEKQGRAQVFQKDRKEPDPYTTKNVFVKHVKSQKPNYDYTQQSQTKKQFHFNYWMVMILGIIGGLVITWRMLRSEKRGQRSTNHRRVTG